MSIAFVSILCKQEIHLLCFVSILCKVENYCCMGVLNIEIKDMSRITYYTQVYVYVQQSIPCTYINFIMFEFYAIYVLTKRAM